MKIGLITYHYSQNYGAVMQTYATCRALKELGHNVEIINIRQEEKRKLRHLVFIPKYLKFNAFMNKYYPTQTPLIHNINELRRLQLDYDCLLVGSDQVWNPLISGDRCLAYFLDFGHKDIKRISYASSFGISSWPESRNYLMKDVYKALHSFDNISVREETGQTLLKNLFKVSSQVVVDPTMLHTDYSEIVDNINETEDIVCYLLNRTEEQLSASRYIGKELNTIPHLITSVYPILGFNYIYPPSIEKWLKYIGGAKLVITDSFHGVVFSLLYRRNFVVFAVDNGKNSRLLDLLNKVGLEGRYFTSLDCLKKSKIYNQAIDYKTVQTIIDKKRKESLDYLRKNLQ